MSVENVAIVLTPPGAAAVAVVRLHGPAVGAFMSTHFSKPAVVGRCVYGNLTDGQWQIDDAIVVATGPKTVDLNVHGGAWVLHGVLDLARRAGFQIRESAPLPLPPEAIDSDGEFQREALAYLPRAKTELGVRALLAQPKAWEALRRSPPGADELRRILTDPTLHHLLCPPTAAIVGVPNAGKSTLANQLFGQERSITADLPGTTRDWVGEIANIDGLPVMLMDTPGLRLTHDPIEQAAIEQSRPRITHAQLIVLVLDATRALEPDQSNLIERFPNAIKVKNKIDCAAMWEIGDLAAIATVATSGKGLIRLRRELVRRFCGADKIVSHRPYCWTPRQRSIIERAVTDSAALNLL